MNVSRLQNEIKVNDCNQNCLPQAVLKHQQKLAQTKNHQDWQRTKALLFLGHWLGDIHQPYTLVFPII